MHANYAVRRALCRIDSRGRSNSICCYHTLRVYVRTTRSTTNERSVACMLRTHSPLFDIILDALHFVSFFAGERMPTNTNAKHCENVLEEQRSPSCGFVPHEMNGKRETGSIGSQWECCAFFSRSSSSVRETRELALSTHCCRVIVVVVVSCKYNVARCVHTYVQCTLLFIPLFFFVFHLRKVCTRYAVLVLH